MLSHCQNGNEITADAAFDPYVVVDFSDIRDDKAYYGGIMFVLSVASQYIKGGQKNRSEYC